MKGEKVYLTLSQDYVQDWGFWEAIRELLQNMIDCDNHKFDEYNSQGDRWVSIKTFDGVIPRDTLLLGNSGKRDDETKVGMYGEGYKLAFLVLTRMGYQVRIKNGFDKWIVTFEKHPQLHTECLCVEIVEGFYNIEDTDSNTVDITVQGLSQEDSQVMNHNYLEDVIAQTHSEDLLVNHKGCQVFRYDTDICEEDRGGLCDTGNPKKVFVNGLFVCDLPDDYVFSYNLTPDKINLDRDRKSVDTWDLQREVAKLLEDSGSFDLMVRMSEQKVPDLYEYYTPSKYKLVGGGNSWSETNENSVSKVLEDLASEKFIERHGEGSIAIDESMPQNKRDIIKNRLKLSGIKGVEIPPTNFRMLKVELKTVPEFAPITNEKPSKLIAKFLKDNKKHMRSKAVKGLEQLIDDLILRD